MSLQMEDRLPQIRARLLMARRALEEAESALTELETERHRLVSRQAPLCSISEAARRLGKSDPFLRALFKRLPDLASRAVYQPEVEGQLMVRWPAMEAWLSGAPPDVELPANVTAIRVRGASA